MLWHFYIQLNWHPLILPVDVHNCDPVLFFISFLCPWLDTFISVIPLQVTLFIMVSLTYTLYICDLDIVFPSVHTRWLLQVVKRAAWFVNIRLRIEQMKHTLHHNKSCSFLNLITSHILDFTENSYVQLLCIIIMVTSHITVS